MPAVILLVILLVVAVLVVKTLRDARRPAPRSEAPSPAPPRPRPRPRPARSQPQVDEAALAEHVRKLRDAVGQGLVSMDDAVASICRATDGALSEEAARELLRRQGAA